METEKYAKEVEERQRKIDEDKAAQIEQQERRKEEIAMRIQNRLESRQLSQARMIEETKKISKKPKLYQEIERKFADDHVKEQERERLEKLKELKSRYLPI